MRLDHNKEIESFYLWKSSETPTCHFLYEFLRMTKNTQNSSKSEKVFFEVGIISAEWQVCQYKIGSITQVSQKF